MLQDANRRTDRADDALVTLSRKYNTLHQDCMALKLSDFCESSQIESDTTPNGGTIELCHQCSQDRHTIESFKRELIKKEEEIRYWQDSHEAVSLQLAEFSDPTLG